MTHIDLLSACDNQIAAEMKQSMRTQTRTHVPTNTHTQTLTTLLVNTHSDHDCMLCWRFHIDSTEAELTQSSRLKYIEQCKEYYYLILAHITRF